MIFKIDWWTYPIFETTTTTACTDGSFDQEVTIEVGDGTGGSIESALVCTKPQQLPDSTL